MLSVLMLVKHPCYSGVSSRRITKECPTLGQVVRAQWGLPYGGRRAPDVRVRRHGLEKETSALWWTQLWEVTPGRGRGQGLFSEVEEVRERNAA